MLPVKVLGSQRIISITSPIKCQLVHKNIDLAPYAQYNFRRWKWFLTFTHKTSLNTMKLLACLSPILLSTRRPLESCAQFHFADRFQNFLLPCVISGITVLIVVYEININKFIDKPSNLRDFAPLYNLKQMWTLGVYLLASLGWGKRGGDFLVWRGGGKSLSGCSVGLLSECLILVNLIITGGKCLL